MKTTRWHTSNQAATETVAAQQTPSGIDFQGSSSTGLTYTIYCDAAWQVWQCRVQLGQQVVQLLSDGQGNWHNGQGQPLPQFAGCYEVDISSTPFTNTLPIRRLRLAGQPGSHLIEVVYIKVPDLTLQLQQQCYTWLRREGEVDTILYENLTSHYSAELLVDAEGLVLDYPGRFERA